MFACWVRLTIGFLFSKFPEFQNPHTAGQPTVILTKVQP